MTPIIYHRISRVFLFLSLALLVVSIGSAISVIVAEFPMRLSLNHQGFESFMIFFGFSIKALTATLATFAIWLTLERLSQTERQINAIVDNNKFNNYSKHLQDFIGYMKDTALFSALYEEEKMAHSIYLAPAYKTYYAETYETFRPRMKDSKRREIDMYYHEITSSVIGSKDCDLSTVPIAEINRISGIASGDVRELIIPLTQKVLSRMQLRYSSLNMPIQQIQSAKDRFEELHVVSWTFAFYRTLLSFDGEIRGTGGYFQDNFERYENALGV